MCPQPDEKSSKNSEPSRAAASAGSANQDVFDVRKIRRLIELMNEHDLTEMDLRQGDTRIQFRRATEAPAAPVARPVVAASAPAPATEASKPSPAATAEASADDKHVALITSPMVGTFYTAPDPDSPPYVKVGDHVGTGTTVCIVEAMKVFNEIQSEVSGKIIAVLAENGEPVEFGQPLFKVDTRQ